MKKIYFLFVVCLVGVTSLQAQKKNFTLKKVNIPLVKGSNPNVGLNGVTSAACDTANLALTDNWNEALYSNNSFGFLSGTNVSLDKQKANYFDLSSTSYNYVTGAWILFGVANSSVAADLLKNVVFRVYSDSNGSPYAEIGNPISIPLSSIKADVDGGYVTQINFNTALQLPASKKFYVSVDVSNFSYANGDSIAVISSTQGDIASGTGEGWEQWDDDSWHNFNDTLSFQYDLNLYIFPFVSTTQSACGILPVTLTSFTAQRNDKDAQISWKVAEEINMKGYELEKAENAYNFKPVTFIQAHNDSKNVSYAYTDANAFANASNVQYRLKQIDNDGVIKYSNIITLKAANVINNVSFANPFNGLLHMQLNLAGSALVNISVYNVNGSLVGVEKPASYSAASSSIELKSTAGLKAGLYFIKVSVGSEVYNYKVIKQ